MNSLPAFDVHTPASRELSKLRILRHQDTKREWQSLEDQRVCVLCGNEFRGKDIVIQIQKGHAVCRCPSRGCHGTIQHFVLPGNPLLEAESYSEWIEALDDLLAEGGPAA